MPNKTNPNVLKAMKRYHAKQMLENPEYRRKKIHECQEVTNKTKTFEENRK